MKFADGPNKFRILSQAVTGYSYWNAENKPVRSKHYPSTLVNIRPGDKVKHFWAFVVWNYATSAIEVLEVTQASIRDEIANLEMNEEWGEVFNYDITVTKMGQKMDTKYSVQPSPHKAVSEAAKKAYAELKIDLTKLFTGENVFLNGADSEYEKLGTKTDVTAYRPSVAKVNAAEGEVDEGVETIE